MEKNVEELTLLLMYLTSWEEKGYVEDNNGNIIEAKIKKSWKGYSFDSINELTNKGLLYGSSYKSKSVSLTKEGEKKANELIEKYLK
jgi:Mn-dependent DtxR family transcriptional regulator